MAAAAPAERPPSDPSGEPVGWIAIAEVLGMVSMVDSAVGKTKASGSGKSKTAVLVVK